MENALRSEGPQPHSGHLHSGQQQHDGFQSHDARVTTRHKGRHSSDFTVEYLPGTDKQCTREAEDAKMSQETRHPACKSEQSGKKWML